MRLFALLLIGAFILGAPAASTTAEAADGGMMKKDSRTKGVMSK